MTLDDLIAFVANLFEKSGIDYFVFGATAMNLWMPPRNTIDVDIVVCVERRKARRVLSILRAHEFPIAKSLERKFLEGRVIKVPRGDVGLDLALCRTAHDREAFRRSVYFEDPEFRLRVATPEDLVLFKLQVWRRQDQADIERILREVHDLDARYVESWLARIEEDTGWPMAARWLEISGSV